MKRKITFLIAALCAVTLITPSFKALGQDKPVAPTVLFHETFGNNSGSARAWQDSYSVKSGISTVYSGLGNYTMTNLKQSKNTVGSTQSGLLQTTKGTDAVFESGPYDVSNYTNLKVIYQWNAVSTKETYSTSLQYKTSSSGAWTDVSGTGNGATSFVERSYSLPAACQVSTLYLKVVFNTSNTGAVIDEFEINCPTYTVTYDCNDGTSGCPDSPVNAPSGTYTLASAPTKSGFTFTGWSDGTNTYNAGASYTLSEAVTFTAQWQSSASPSIVINDGTPIALAKGASGDQTATVAYNNMSGYSSPSVALFNDSGCTEAFTGGWFSASLSGEGSTTLTYSANANTVGERTVYIKVSAIYNEESIVSVLAATQATSTRTVTYNANGGTGTTTDSNSPYNYGSAVTAVSNNFTAPSGKIFNCWNTQADGKGTNYADGAQITASITDDITLYAQWVDEPTFTLVTNISQIVPGAHCIIANGEGNSASIYAMGYQKSNNRDAVSVSTTSDGKIKNPGEDIYQFVISGYEDNWTFYDTKNKVDNKGFLYATKNSNYLKNKSTLDNNGKWSISIAGDNHATITVTYDNGDNTTTVREMRYNANNGTPLFSCYTSGYDAVYLYIKDNDPNIHPYSPTTYEEGTTVTISDNITINNTNPITIEDGAVVRFTGTLTSATATNLVVKDGGQLILKSTNAGVQATFQKDIANASAKGVADHWYTISTPTGGINITDVTNLVDNEGHTLQYNLFRYDEPSHMWEAYNPSNHADFTTLEKGRGYLYRNNGKDLEFPGEVNVGDVTVHLTNTSSNGDLRGFNLIGNPYGHNIYKGAGAAIADAKLNDGFYYLTNEGGWHTGTYETVITPKMGILVQLNNSYEELDLTITDKPNAATAERYANDNLMFTVSNNDYEDVTYAMFHKGYGLSKINHRNADIPMLYINHDNENYALAMMSDDTKAFNLCFKAKTTGQYKLTYKAEGEFSYLHVIDRLTGADVDMLLEGEYSFIGTPNDNVNRFIVSLGYMPDYSEGNSDIFAFQSGNEVLVSGEGELQIFDVTGRSVMTTTINGAESINLSASGVYIFRLIGTEVKTQKIVVR